MFDTRTSPPEPSEHVGGLRPFPHIGSAAVDVLLSEPGVAGGDMLAAHVRDQQPPAAPIWLRVARHDAVPGVFSTAVRYSVERNAPAVAREVTDRLGPVDESASVDATHLADVLATAGGDDFVIVLEDPQGIGPSTEAAAFLRRYSQHGRVSSPVIVLVERRRWRPARWSVPGCRETAITRRAALIAAEEVADDRFRRVIELTGGRACLAGDVVAAAEGTRRELVDGVIDRSRRWRSFRRRLTDAFLADAGPVAVEALCSALGAEYVHLDDDDPIPGALRPWLVPLQGGGFWLRPAWAPALDRGLARRSRRRRASVVRSAPPSLTTPVLVPTTSCDAEPTTIAARLYGGFELEVAGTPVVEWKSRRGLSVLKYLLAHPKRDCPRDVLLDVFWPDVDPDKARNRLHVALSAMRRSVRAVANLDIVEHHDGGYRVPPSFEVSLDTVQLEQLVELGRRQELQHEFEKSSSLYLEAASLYRGEFLADDPYEPWTVLPRETLRVHYLDLLDRLAQLLISTGRVSESIEVAQRILVEDDCREDAHRLLMRCYTRQGRVSQVDRQYELCRRTLSNRLDAPPSATTIAVYKELRARALSNESHDWRYS